MFSEDIENEDSAIVSKDEYSENTGVPKEDIESEQVGVIYGKPPKDKPSDAALQMFEEWKGVESNIRSQLGWFDPTEVPQKLNSDWNDEYKRRTGLSWELMEGYSTKQEQEAKKEFMKQRLSGYKSMFSSIEKDVSAAKSMWKTQRAKQLKEEEKKLKMEQEAEANPVLNLYNKAKAGDMEAWNELYNMQRNAERAEEAERERKMRIEAAKPIKMSKLQAYESEEVKSELKSLKDEAKKKYKTWKQKEPKEGTKPSKDDINEANNAKQEYLKVMEEFSTQDKKYREWLANFAGDDVDAADKIKPGKKLDLKKKEYYLKKANYDREEATYLAEQDGYDE